MAINGIRDIVDCELEGRVREYGWVKKPANGTSKVWMDLAITPGNPPPKYYFDSPPLIAKAIAQSTDGGIYHGANVAPSTKYLRKILATANVINPLPIPMILCDYLLYYPTIDDSVTDPQMFDNTVTLPRYTDGDGVQVMAISLASRTGGASFYFTYTNSNGDTGRVSQTVQQNSSTALGVLLNSESAANNSTAQSFIGLQNGDTGVRSIQSVTMLSADTGLFALVLVRPLADLLIRGIYSPVEIDYYIQKGELPIIKDDAFLNFIVQPNGAVASAIFAGELKCIWS